MTAADEDDVRRELTELVRASGRDVLATLARWTGNLALAEDAVQDATVRALETWPRDGVPAWSSSRGPERRPAATTTTSPETSASSRTHSCTSSTPASRHRL